MFDLRLHGVVVFLCVCVCFEPKKSGNLKFVLLYNYIIIIHYYYTFIIIIDSLLLLLLYIVGLCVCVCGGGYFEFWNNQKI